MRSSLGRERSSKGWIVFGAGLVTALVLQPSPAAAQWLGMAGSWSAPGSTGVADEASLPFVTVDHAKAAVRSTSPAGSVVVLRYPVFLSGTWAQVVPDPIDNTPMFLTGFYTQATLTFSFQRNEEAALLVAILRRVRLSDGATTMMVAVDGNSSLPSPGVQTVTRTLLCDGPCVQADQYAYWVEVALWKVRATSDPKVVAVGVHLRP
jgi:hypothetical protein